MNSVAEIAIGTAVEVGIFAIATAVVYRLFAGRFLIPKREVVLPYQRGVLVTRSNEMSVMDPGPCWVRPGCKLLLLDVRPRTLQVENVEVLSIQGIPVRLNISAKYGISDPVQFMSSSGNAADALWFELRRTIASVARQWISTAMTAAGGVESISQRVSKEMRESSARIGMELISFEIWEINLQKDSVRTAAPDNQEAIN